MKHQRVRKGGTEETPEDMITNRVVISEEPVQKYRVGACTNCGSKYHQAKDCLERPRKVGAKYKPVDIRPDEFVESKELSFDGKRDRWAGYDAEEYREVIDAYDAVETERQKLKAQEKESSDTTSSSSSSSSDSESNSDDDKYGESVDMPGQMIDTKNRMTVRNLRLREDTAKYLRNLDPDSAYYDPKTRSMRDNPHPEVEDPSLLPYAGDNFIRQSGDALKVPQLQVFAWQVEERQSAAPVEVSLQANPTLLEKRHKEFEKEKSKEARSRQQMLLEAYGDATKASEPEEEDDSWL